MPSQLETEVVNLFRELTESLPPGCASLKVEPSLEPLVGGTQIELIPAVPGAARILAVATGRGVVYLTFGRATPFEAQVERGTSPSTLIEGIKPICKAVIEGKFQEDLWLAGPRAFKSIGKLNIGGKVVTIRYRGSFHPFNKTKKEHVNYVPFTG